MDAVDETVQTAPVRIGIGTPLQEDALRGCGAERVIFTHTLDKLSDAETRDIFAAAFRVEDIAVLIQPSLLTLRQLRLIGDRGAHFEVPGHAPTVACNDQERRALRQLKPKGVKAPKLERRGGKVKYPQPTEEQARHIVGLWHSSAKLAVVCDAVRAYMGADVPDSWVRDRVRKYTGSAARSPLADGKHEFRYDQ